MATLVSPVSIQRTFNCLILKTNKLTFHSLPDSFFRIKAFFLPCSFIWLPKGRGGGCQSSMHNSSILHHTVGLLWGIIHGGIFKCSSSDWNTDSPKRKCLFPSAAPHDAAADQQRHMRLIIHRSLQTTLSFSLMTQAWSPSRTSPDSSAPLQKTKKLNGKSNRRCGTSSFFFF